MTFITGPTGSGKTELAQYLFKDLFTCLVNIDSRHFYSQFCVGTGRPSFKDCLTYNYKMVGFLNLQDSYNAYRYLQDSLPILEQSQEKICVVGGSLFYVTSILHGLPESPDIPNKVREKILNQYEKETLNTLLQKLLEKDPECFQIIDKGNSRRILRALEFIEATNTKYSMLKKSKKKSLRKSSTIIIPFIPRKILYERINERVIQMFKIGWEEEVFSLYKKEILNFFSVPAIGYFQVLERILGKISLSECIETIQRKTRNLAKRQTTWIKKLPKVIHWINKEDININNLNAPEDIWIHSKEKFTPENDATSQENVESFQWYSTKNELKIFLKKQYDEKC